MGKIRILCTADLHLGRSSAVAVQCGDVDLSTGGAWRRMVDVAVLEQADAVIVAGDLFDAPGSYLEARGNFLAGLHLLDVAKIPVIAVTGNHDWNVLPLLLREAPDNFHLLGRGGVWERQRLTLGNGTVEFVGWSFPGERVGSSQLSGLQILGSPDCPVIGVLHGDTAPSSPYHPISEFELSDKADAWVVGHIHKPGAIGKNSHYPGSPQSLDFGPGERGCHGFCWLEIESGIPNFSKIVSLSTARFEVLNLEVEPKSGVSGYEAAMDMLQRKCLDICRQDPETESVHLRAHVSVVGDSVELSPIDAGISAYLDRHSIEILSIRSVRTIDPWSLKDLRDVTGEAARLLIGARALVEDEETEAEIPEKWIEDARKLVDQSAKDIEVQFQRTLATVSDQGESAVSILSESDLYEKAHSLLIDELNRILQEAKV